MVCLHCKRISSATVDSRDDNRANKWILFFDSCREGKKCSVVVASAEQWVSKTCKHHCSFAFAPGLVLLTLQSFPQGFVCSKVCIS